MRANIDPILVDDIRSDDEWTSQKEEPIFSIDITWMDDEYFLNVAAIKNVPISSNEDTINSLTPKDLIGSSSEYKTKKNGRRLK